MYRSEFLVPLGWFLAFSLYCVQASILMKFLAEHTGSDYYWFGVLFYVFLLIYVVYVVSEKLEGCAESNREVWYVWFIWFLYIILFTISVVMIFAKVADKLETSDTYGPNFLKNILCITPALLVLLLQLLITPSCRKAVLSLSVFAALDLFDGIEMLEIVLMQNERKDFNLNDIVEMLIVLFACLNFIVTSLGLVRYKFKINRHLIDMVESDGELVPFFSLMQILCTNVPFLALRIYVWADSGYDASIFIAKNIVSLVIGLTQCSISCGCFTCE